MATTRNRLAEILRRAEELRGRGESISVEELCEAFPDLILEVRQRLDAADRLSSSAMSGGNRISSASDDQIDLISGLEPLPGYRLVQRLGRGGYGEVWKASAPGGFEVALKFVTRSADQLRIEERALDLIKSLHHPNLLTTFGSWQTERYLVIAMELADGTLQDRFREAVGEGNQGIPREELLEYLYEAAKGIDFLNGDQLSGDGPDHVGIQHRDIKPENILMVGNGVKVADFGLARLLDGTQTGHTGHLTHLNAAPEFFKGKTTQHSDQYSLAVTYCQLRTGKSPFEGSPAEVMYGHLTQPPNLSMLPANERSVIARALSKTADQRWPSCLSFVQALRTGQSTPNALSSRGLPKKRPVPPRAIGLAGLIIAACIPITVVGLQFRAHGLKGSVAPAETHMSENHSESSRAQDPAPQRSESGSDQAAATNRIAIRDELKPPVREEESPLAIPTMYFSKSSGMQFALIPAGAFVMGSSATMMERHSDEGPVHRVRISHPFYLGCYEVTQQEYFKATGSNPSYFSRSGGGSVNKLRGQDTSHYPVEEVSWYDAVEFCNRLSQHDGLTPRYQKSNVVMKDGAFHSAEISVIDGTGYRLPTEAEWEYACRNKTTTAFWFGNELDGNQANIKGTFPYGTTVAGPFLERTAPVGSYRPTPQGIYDLHGNVSEWCWDMYDEQLYSSRHGVTIDPAVNSGSDYRVLRGGSWDEPAALARSTSRQRISPSSRFYSIGFRVVKEVSRRP